LLLLLHLILVSTASLAVPIAIDSFMHAPELLLLLQVISLLHIPPAVPQHILLEFIPAYISHSCTLIRYLASKICDNSMTARVALLLLLLLHTTHHCLLCSKSGLPVN
jgi:hypothetical protein